MASADQSSEVIASRGQPGPDARRPSLESADKLSGVTARPPWPAALPESVGQVWEAVQAWLVDAVPAMSLAVFTASATIAAEAMWPIAPTSVPTLPTPYLVSAGLSFVFLLGGLAWRSALRSSRGTLYYLRMLDVSMADTQLASLRTLSRRHLDVRAVTRWLSDAPTVFPGGRKLDVANEVRCLARDTQLTMNDDDVATGFNIAPNMLWPMAMAFGSHLYPLDGTHLIEPEQKTLSEVAWGLLAAPPASERTALEMEQVVAGDEGEAVLLTLELGGPIARQGPDDGPGDSLPARWRSLTRYRLVPQARTEDDGLDAICLTKRDERRASPGGRPFQYVNPNVAAIECVRAIRGVLHAHPNQMVVLTARLPKTVSLAIGWLMSQKPTSATACLHQGCRQESCQYPWSRLITVQLDGINEPLVTRVHENQLALDHMVAACALVTE